MTRKNTKSVTFTAMMALLVILAIGFEEAFAEIFDVGEWRMITLELSEMSETYADVVTTEGKLENVMDQSNTIDIESVAAKNAYLDAFQEVIRFQ